MKSLQDENKIKTLLYECALMVSRFSTALWWKKSESKFLNVLWNKRNKISKSIKSTKSLNNYQCVAVPLQVKRQLSCVEKWALLFFG